MCIMHFDSGACTLPQLRYGFTTSAYQSAHMNNRDEESVADLYVRLPRHVLHLHIKWMGWLQCRGCCRT